MGTAAAAAAARAAATAASENHPTPFIKVLLEAPASSPWMNVGMSQRAVQPKYLRAAG